MPKAISIFVRYTEGFGLTGLSYSSPREVEKERKPFGEVLKGGANFAGVADFHITAVIPFAKGRRFSVAAGNARAAHTPPAARGEKAVGIFRLKSCEQPGGEKLAIRVRVVLYSGGSLVIFLQVDSLDEIIKAQQRAYASSVVRDDQDSR